MYSLSSCSSCATAVKEEEKEEKDKKTILKLGRSRGCLLLVCLLVCAFLCGSKVSSAYYPVPWKALFAVFSFAVYKSDAPLFAVLQ